MEGRMAAAGAGRDANRVDGPDLAPDRRLGRRDDVLLLLLEDVGDLLSQRGRLVVDPGQLIAGRADLLGEVRLRLLLLRLEVDQLGQVGGLLVAQLDLLVARGLLLLQVGVELGEVELELALERLGPRAGGAEVVDPGQHVAQAGRLHHQEEDRARLGVDGAGEGADLRFLALDPGVHLVNVGIEPGDLALECHDLGVGLRDGAFQHLLLGGVVAERLGHPIRGLEGGRQLGAELGADRLDDGRPGLGGRQVGRSGRRGGRRSGKQEERDQRGHGEPQPHDSRYLRTLPREEREPRTGPMTSRTTPITSPACRVNPGASWAKLEAPAWTAIPQARRARTPATPPATAPVRAPSMTKGPRTIQSGAPTSCMIPISSPRERIAARRLLAGTVTAMKASSSSKARPMPATHQRTCWKRL